VRDDLCMANSNFWLKTGDSAGLLCRAGCFTLFRMRDLFILLGHLLTTIAKLMGAERARAIITGYYSSRWQCDWQFAVHT